MANLQKYTRGATGHLFAHFERRLNEKGEPIKFSNQEIRTELSHLNYNLALQDQPQNQIAFLQKRMSEVECDKRKTTNVMCSWVVTVPKDLEEKYHENFFKESYNFLKNRYGKENVISAYVHLDETTPHLHFSFCPVWKNENGAEKFCAKNIFTRMELKKFHSDLQNFLEEKLQTNVNVLNGVTQGKNKTISQLKAENEKNFEEEKTEMEKLKQQFFKKTLTGKIVVNENQQELILNSVVQNEKYKSAVDNLVAIENQNTNDRIKIQNVYEELEREKAESKKRLAYLEQAEADLQARKENVEQIIDDRVERLLKLKLGLSEKYQRYMEIQDKYQKYVMPRKDRENGSRNIKNNTNSKADR